MRISCYIHENFLLHNRREAIRNRAESVPVKEIFEGQTAWEGTVEVFDLVGHLEAKRAYAWSYRDGDQMKSVAVLGVPPVDSPQSAVKVAIAAKEKTAIASLLPD
jgi:hypothetical protein